MTLLLERVVELGDDREVLAAILRTDCALAVWRRALPNGLGALATLDHSALDDIDATVAVDDATIRVAVLIGAAGYPADVAVPLVRDVGAMVAAHAMLWGWGSVRLRLDWIETDACRRFHADMLGTRLLVTYAGRGTQWRLAGEPNEAARQCEAGEVVMLKGRLLAPDAPVLHRSPPIAEEGGRRLLLTVDAAR